MTRERDDRDFARAIVWITGSLCAASIVLGLFALYVAPGPPASGASSPFLAGILWAVTRFPAACWHYRQCERRLRESEERTW